jgi:putative ABC transport system substrate-binding protein
MSRGLLRIQITLLALCILLAGSTAPAADPVPAAGAPAAAAVAPAAVPAPLPPLTQVSDWIKFDIERVGGGTWKASIASPGTDQAMLRITPTRPNGKKIVVLMDVQAAYTDTALKTFLAIYADKGYYPTITLANYQKDAGKLARVIGSIAAGEYDLAITLGSNALKDAHKKLQGKKVPVVTMCNKDPVLLKYVKTYDKGSGDNFAFTSVNTPIDVQMTFLKKLAGEIKAVAILVDRSNKSAMETQYKPFKEALEKEGIAVVDVIVGPEDDKDPKLLEIVKADLAAMVPEGMAKLAAADPGGKGSVFWLTYCTSIVKNLETLNQNTGTVPVVGVATDTVLEGDNSTVIGIGVSFESNAYTSAMYGMNILSGKVKPGDLPVGLTSPPDIAINFKRARAIGMKIPFAFFESANIVYGADGVKARDKGQKVAAR